MTSSDDEQKLTGVRSRYIWLFVTISIVVVMGIVLIARRQNALAAAAQHKTAAAAEVPALASSNNPAPSNEVRVPVEQQPLAVDPANAAAQQVSNKLVRFTQIRHALLKQMAGKAAVELPAEVQQFFDLAEKGEWEGIRSRYKEMKVRLQGDDEFANKMTPLWGPIASVYGAAEQAQKWPPRQLLNYGHTIFKSLSPGMVYFGGTDEGRFIPELLSATEEGEQHIVITQNALVDSSYLPFLRALYGERLKLLSGEELDRTFQEYATDAEKRFAHDRDFPSEPKQMKAGEKIDWVNNRVQFSGMVAVMAINERMLLALIQKNPERAFALEEAYPFRQTYRSALPLGAVTQIAVPDAQSKFTAERAKQAVDFWEATVNRLSGDAEASASQPTTGSYSKLATGQANLLADWQHLDHAGRIYRLSLVLWPGNIESMGGLAELLIRTGRPADANKVMEDFDRAFPERAKQVERTRARLRSIRVTTPLPRK